MINKSDKVACIVLNWRNAGATASCLKSVLKGDLVPGTIFVIDNHSGDDACTQIHADLVADRITYSLMQRVRVLWLDTTSNIGYAAANNIAISQVLNDPEIEYLWILNNDVCVNAAGLNTLLEYTKQDLRIGFTGGLVDDLSTGKVYCYGGGSVIERVGLCQRNMTPPDSEKYEELDYVMGCNMLVRTAAIRQFGLMDESFFMYSEEVDWQIRARKLGWRVGYVRECRVTRSSSGLSDSYYYYRIRSSILLSRKYGGEFWACVSFFMNSVLLLIRRPSWRSIQLGFLGCVDGFRGVKGRSMVLSSMKSRSDPNV